PATLNTANIPFVYMRWQYSLDRVHSEVQEPMADTRHSVGTLESRMTLIRVNSTVFCNVVRFLARESECADALLHSLLPHIPPMSTSHETRVHLMHFVSLRPELPAHTPA